MQPSIYLKCFGLVKCKHFAEGHGVVDREDLHLPLGLALATGVVPHQLDGVGLDVRDGELPHLEHRREDGALEGAAPGHGLVSIECGGGLLGEHLLYHGLDGGDTRAAPDNLNANKVCLKI